MRSSKFDYEEECSQERRDKNWFHTLFRWIITINGDPIINETNNARNYRYLPTTTNYIFFLGGRFRQVKDTQYLSLGVLLIIIIPMVLFSIFETGKLWHTEKGYKLLVIWFYYIWAICLGSFIKTATSDPGVLPVSYTHLDVYKRQAEL